MSMGYEEDDPRGRAVREVLDRGDFRQPPDEPARRYFKRSASQRGGTYPAGQL